MNKRIIIIFFIALLMCMIFISLVNLDKTGPIKADAHTYFIIGKNLSQGYGFTYESSPPYSPNMEREPAYSVFLGIIFFLFGINIFIVQLIQAFVFAVTCVLVYKIASKVAKGNIPFIAALATASFPTLANYTAYLLSETLFTFLLTFSVLALMKSFESDRLKWFFISGITIGLASLCRATLMFFGIFVAALIVAYYLWENSKVTRNTLAKALFLALLGFTIVITPWMTRNYILFKKCTISTRGFASLYVRATKVNLDKNELKMYAVYCLSEYAAGKLYPEYRMVSSSEGYFYKPLVDKISEYSKLKMSAAEMDSAFKKESLSLILAHPVKFIATGVFEFIKFNSFAQIPLLNDRPMQDLIKSNYFFAISRGMFKLLGFLILIFAIIGIFSCKKDTEWAVLFTVVLYFNLIHLFADSVGRYALPIIPFYLVFCILGINFFTNLNKN